MATMLGWSWWHVRDSRKQQGGRWVGDGEIAGYPDLTLAHPRLGIGFVEVKGDGGRLSPKQKIVLPRLATAAVSVPRGLFVQVWFPDDWDDVVVPVLQGTYTGDRFHGVPV